MECLTTLLRSAHHSSQPSIRAAACHRYGHLASQVLGKALTESEPLQNREDPGDSERWWPEAIPEPQE